MTDESVILTQYLDLVNISYMVSLLFGHHILPLWANTVSIYFYHCYFKVSHVGMIHEQFCHELALCGLIDLWPLQRTDIVVIKRWNHRSDIYIQFLDNLVWVSTLEYKEKQDVKMINWLYPTAEIGGKTFLAKWKKLFCLQLKPIPFAPLDQVFFFYNCRHFVWFLVQYHSKGLPFPLILLCFDLPVCTSLKTVIIEWDRISQRLYVAGIRKTVIWKVIPGLPTTRKGL